MDVGRVRNGMNAPRTQGKHPTPRGSTRSHPSRWSDQSTGGGAMTTASLARGDLATTARVGRLGFRAGVAAFTATVAYLVAQVLQLAGVLHFPLDEILIFGTSLCIVLPFVFEILALHYCTTDDKRFWTHAALLF